MQKKPKHKTLFFLHYAIVFGVLLFGLVIFYTTPTAKLSFENDGTFFIIGPVLAVLALLFHNKLFVSSIQKLNSETSLQEKFARYQTGHIIRLAILEAAAFFNIVATMFTENLLFLMIAAFLLLVMLYHKPTKDKIKTALQLSEFEATELFEEVN